MNGDEKAIDRPLRDFGLWLGILGPPIAWLIQFQSIYMLVYRACGAGRNVIVAAMCVVCFVLIALMAVYPWRNAREGSGSQTRVSRTRRFMSRVGIMSAVMFNIVVIAQWVAALMIDPCVI